MNVRNLIEHVCMAYYSYSGRSGEKDMDYTLLIESVKQILEVDQLTKQRLDQITRAFSAYGIAVVGSTTAALITFKIDYKTLVVNFKEAVLGKKTPNRNKTHRPYDIPPYEITKIRKQLKLNQYGFAELIGTTQSLVNQWENGRSRPSGAVIVLLRIVERHPDVVAEANNITNWKDLQSEKVK